MGGGLGSLGNRPKRRDRLQKLLMGPAKDIKELTERTLDLYWASRTGNHKLAASLLRRGADPTVCHPDSGEGPLHVAAFHGHFKVVQALLENGCGPNVRTAFPADETALHVLVRNCSATKNTWTRAREDKCLQELLAAPGLDIDACDGSGLTPVHLAVRFGLWDFVEVMLTRKPNLDLRADGESVREIILRDSGRQWNNLPQRRSESQVISNLQIMVACLRDRRDDDFLQLLNSIDDDKMSKGEFQVCLKTACSYGCLEAVKHLLYKGADPNDYVCEPPIVMAAKLGHADVLQALLETGTVVLNRCDHPLWQRSPLHLAVISASSSSSPGEYLRCISLLVERKYGLDVDNVDFRGNTALHYAAKSPQRDLTRLLLLAGCNVFVCNQQDEPGFLHVGIDELRVHLDSFISQKGLAARNHSLELDYQFLRQGKRHEGIEMQPVLLLGRSKIHRPLLNHPLLTSFLHLKWQRLKSFFYCKFLAYFLFATALSIHIYHVIQATALESTQYVRWTSVALLGVFVFGETLEACVSLKKYLNSFENVLKMVLIILSVVLLFAGQAIEPWPRRHVATATVICAYVELALLIGTHPRFATYIDMYLRVARNFAGLFFLFSFLIFAFAFSFFVLFHDTDNRFFSTLGGSIFKTVIMLTGEMEAENLDTDLLGYLLFLAFVLFVPICLLNLVTGLAVSDIAAIRQEAEVGLIAAKVELYANIESLLLGSALRGLPRCCCSFVERKIRLLGNSLADSKLVWYLDFDNKMEPDSSQVSWFSKFVPDSVKKFRRLEWLAIVDEAQKISSVRTSDQQVATLSSLEAKIEQMQAQIIELMNALKDVSRLK